MKKAIQLLFFIIAFITLVPLTNTVYGSLTLPHLQPSLLSPPPQSSPTPPPPRGYTGLDILFIVDQSGSMGGATFGRDDRPIPNDPNGFRFIAPQYALDWLSSYRQVVLKATDTRIRMSLLAFGSFPEIQLNWTPLVEDRSGAAITVPTIWEEQLTQLREDISVERFGFTNYGLTNFVAAIEEADQIFDRAPALPSGEKHLRAIVLLTDGAPCTQLGSARCGTQQFSRDHLNEVSQLIALGFPEPDYRVFVVAFNTIDDPNDSEGWPFLGSLWDNAMCPPGRTTCPPDSVVRIQSFEELAPTFNDILTQLVNETQPPTVIRIPLDPSGGTIQMPPFQQVMSINLFKNNEEPIHPDGMTVTAPAGPLPTFDHSRGADSYIEVHGINDPAPGPWTIAIANPENINSIIVDRIAASLEMLPIPRSAEHTVVTIECRVLNESGGILEHDGAPYPLTVTADLYDTATNTLVASDIQFTLQPGNDYRYVANWIPNGYSGRLRAEVTAEYDFNGTTEYLAQNAVLGTFDVTDTYIDNLGVNPSSLLEGTETAEVRALVTDKTSGDPVLEIEHMAMRISIESLSDLSFTPINEILANDNSEPGAIRRAFDAPDAPGEYQVVTTVVDLSDPANPVDISGTTVTNTLEVRAANRLVLSATFVPAEDTMAAIENELFELFPRTPTELRVEVRDAAGDLVSLPDVTNQDVEVPDLTLTVNGDPVEDAELRAVPGQPSVYTYITRDIFLGDVEASVSVNTEVAQMAGDFRWGQRTTTTTIDRVFPRSVLFTLLQAALITISVLACTIGAVVWVRQQRIHPLKGEIQLIARRYNERTRRSDDDELVTMSLDSPTRNTRRVPRAQLAGTPLKSIKISTQRKRTVSEQKQAYIEVHLNDKKAPQRFPINSGQERSFYTDSDDIQYIIAKDRATKRYR